jgi:hypothetical protein
MAFEMPVSVRPAWRFCFHVVVGSFAFLIVYLVAMGVDAWVDWSSRHGAHPWMVTDGGWVSFSIFWLDIFGLSLFLLKETIKFIRSLIYEDWD